MSNIFMRFPGGKAKALTLSYDDGVRQDKKLIQILNNYGIKATFNLNSGLFADNTSLRRMTKQECLKLYSGSGHEIAAHGLTHPFMEQLPPVILCKEVIEDRKNLENMFGTIVRGMAYPFGKYNDNVKNILKNTGIVYSRTVNSTENFDIPDDWLALNPTCHHNNKNLDELIKKFVSCESKYGPWLFYLWGHSYEFDDNNNWDLIKKFCAYAGEKDDIWYATNIEIYDYTEAYKRLRFSADGTLVENPNTIDICFMSGNELFEVKSGSRLKIN